MYFIENTYGSCRLQQRRPNCVGPQSSPNMGEILIESSHNRLGFVCWNFWRQLDSLWQLPKNTEVRSIESIQMTKEDGELKRTQQKLM